MCRALSRIDMFMNASLVYMYCLCPKHMVVLSSVAMSGPCVELAGRDCRIENAGGGSSNPAKFVIG